ncbi:unnamed protein product [Leptosia nina]|uniref:Uncharacterized protein n=1 Tax=Leptosia nina TaxID=320188 RepID=A0AAV1JZ16_9NEOP
MSNAEDSWEVAVAQTVEIKLAAQELYLEAAEWVAGHAHPLADCPIPAAASARADAISGNDCGCRRPRSEWQLVVRSDGVVAADVRGEGTEFLPEGGRNIYSGVNVIDQRQLVPVVGHCREPSASIWVTRVHVIPTMTALA